jgi:cellulose synthase/poly-beta-1,6-N-acetylglucosamine synthase-like glycosyltransferase
LEHRDDRGHLDRFGARSEHDEDLLPGGAVMILATIVIVFSLTYALFTFGLSRRPRPELPPAPDDLLFVYLVPCLNEAEVICETLDRLVPTLGDRGIIVVVDDGSDDFTGEIVRRRYAGHRVAVLRRNLPNARQGKGEALNAAYRALIRSAALTEKGTDSVIVAVVDADGHMPDDALDAVAPYFGDQKIGAVQIGVRMLNRSENLLCRLQDMEFVVFTDLFQRGREWFGSVGLGGNGQFVRLSALQSLGDAPWSQCLTEDLDLGVKLITEGWTNRYCPDVAVTQEAVPSIRRLIRQRSRWFQGHLQCLGLIPRVMRATKLSVKASFDVVYQLTSPILVLITSFVVTTFFLSVAWLTLEQVVTRDAIVPPGRIILWGYVLTFGMAPIFGLIYSKREPSFGKGRAFAMAHLYSGYAALWFAAAWISVWYVLRRQHGWSKTTRHASTIATDGP